MESIHHFEIVTKVFFGEMFQHASIHKALHERTAILRQTKTRKPLIANPLVVHFTICQSLQPAKPFIDNKQTLQLATSNPTHAQLTQKTLNRIQVYAKQSEVISLHCLCSVSNFFVQSSYSLKNTRIKVMS